MHWDVCHACNAFVFHHPTLFTKWEMNFYLIQNKTKESYCEWQADGKIIAVLQLSDLFIYLFN